MVGDSVKDDVSNPLPLDARILCCELMEVCDKCQVSHYYVLAVTHSALLKPMADRTESDELKLEICKRLLTDEKGTLSNAGKCIKRGIALFFAKVSKGFIA